MCKGRLLYLVQGEPCFLKVNVINITTHPGTAPIRLPHLPFIRPFVFRSDSEQTALLLKPCALAVGLHHINPG
jgi:hypothetical protein